MMMTILFFRWNLHWCDGPAGPAVLNARLLLHSKSSFGIGHHIFSNFHGRARHCDAAMAFQTDGLDPVGNYFLGYTPGGLGVWYFGGTLYQHAVLALLCCPTKSYAAGSRDDPGRNKVYFNCAGQITDIPVSGLHYIPSEQVCEAFWAEEYTRCGRLPSYSIHRFYCC